MRDSCKTAHPNMTVLTNWCEIHSIGVCLINEEIDRATFCGEQLDQIERADLKRPSKTARRGRRGSPFVDGAPKLLVEITALGAGIRRMSAERMD